LSRSLREIGSAEGERASEHPVMRKIDGKLARRCVQAGVEATIGRP
jgi:hypothetical protein